MQSTSELAYAKVNLFLGITEKRSDGFHEISSVMHSLSLSDRLTVRIEKTVLPEMKLRVLPKSNIPEDQRNLVWRAAEAYLRYVNASVSVDLVLEKSIPSEAGLGGGSSDAAATLRALDRLLGYRLSSEELSDIAAELGSDVPFCLFGGTALCTGRGEKLVRISEPLSLSAVICKGSESVSTPKAYGTLDRLYRDFSDPSLLPPQSAEGMAALCRAGDAAAVSRGLYNVFEDAVYPVCPEALAQRNRLLSLGADGALLSGSGSAVFGLFSDLRAAREAASSLDGLAFAVQSAPASIPYAL
jgi:4-diphosphocytidyl-2-C-methyl-D-erythritol kinase